MEQKEMLQVLTENYPFHIEKIEFLRDGGSLTYAVSTSGEKYFLRMVRPEFMATAIQSIEIHLYLLEKGFPVPKIILTNHKAPYVKSNGKEGSCLYILYEYIEGEEPDREKDIENIGDLVGRFHKTMRNYHDKLVTRDKDFFINRYINLLNKMEYPSNKVKAFREHGDILWDKVKDLPRGYCHGDLYIGNIYRSQSGERYILDFDTSCNAFPIYDVALVCNATDYFNFNEDGYGKTYGLVERFMQGYEQHCHINEKERQAIGDLLAIYHYQLQATIIEINGLQCVDHSFFNNQYEWLMRWKEQCK